MLTTKQILALHTKWLRYEEGGQRLAWYQLELEEMESLSDADLRDAVLSRADLRDAVLSDANLRDADLSRADLSRADLNGTCLSYTLHELQRQFVKACPVVGRHGGRIVYRTAKSQHIGSTEYEPGHSYTAPWLSFSAENECHPGIYVASREWMADNYPGVPLVRCYVRDGDWTISAKGAIRCKKLRILSEVA